MPKPSWPPQPWARPCPETALSPAVDLGCLGACPPWGREDRRATPWGLWAALHQAHRHTGASSSPVLPGQGEVTTSGSDPCLCSSTATFPATPPVCSCLPEPSCAGVWGKEGNRTGSMAAAVLVGVIYIVYKSIKQSVLLSALHPGGLVLVQRRTAQGWHGEGRDSSHPPTDSLVPIRIHFNHCCSV